MRVLLQYLITCSKYSHQEGVEIRDGLLYSTNNYWVALKSRLAEDEEQNQRRMEKVEMVGSLSHLYLKPEEE